MEYINTRPRIIERGLSKLDNYPSTTNHRHTLGHQIHPDQTIKPPPTWPLANVPDFHVRFLSTCLSIW